MRDAGCRRVYVNSSFVAAKDQPGDFDACWEAAKVDSRLLDPTLLDFSDRRRAPKLSGGELFPAEVLADPAGTRFLDYFQQDKTTGARKGDRRPRSEGSSVITNERQFRITRAQLKRFDEAARAQAARDPSSDVDPRIHAAMGDALQSEAEELRCQLHEYERLRAGDVKTRNLRSLTDLPRALIEARIAGHVTQKELAERLDVAEQQIQRWEATNYAGVGVERIQTVADALGARITEKISFGAPPGTPRRARSTADADRDNDAVRAKRVRSVD